MKSRPRASPEEALPPPRLFAARFCPAMHLNHNQTEMRKFTHLDAAGIALPIFGLKGRQH
jgi:hypothetical protein